MKKIQAFGILLIFAACIVMIVLHMTGAVPGREEKKLIVPEFGTTSANPDGALIVPESSPLFSGK